MQIKCIEPVQKFLKIQNILSLCMLFCIAAYAKLFMYLSIKIY